MSGITLNDLLAGLANQLANQFPTVSSDVVRKALEAEQAASAERAVGIMRGLIRAGQDSIKSSAVALKAALATVATREQALYGLDRAVQYMFTTGNPLPYYKHIGDMRGASDFCKQIGIDTPDSESAAWVVPDDYKVDVTPNVAAVAQQPAPPAAAPAE